MTSTQSRVSHEPALAVSVPAAAAPVPPAVRLGRVVVAEWIKARSVPSTWAALSTFAVIMLGIGAAITLTRDEADLTAAQRAAFEPVAESLSGVFMGQVALGVLGALLVTTEYSSRSILVTVVAVPGRGTLLAGKAVLLTALVLPIAVVVTAGAAALGLTVLDGKGLGADLTDPAVLRAVAGGAVYLASMSVLGLAVGAILRSTAATVVVLTVALFLLPVLIGLLPAAVADAIGPWLPSRAGQAVLQLHDPPATLDPLLGLAVLGGWVAAALAIAAVAIRRRDA